MNMHNCSLVPKTIFKLKINVFFSLGGREKSICLTTTGCGCLFKFSNLYNQFTNEYISITPVNSHVFLMQESILFGLSLLFFPKKAYHMKKNVWALWEWKIFKLWGSYGLMYPRKSTRCWRPCQQWLWLNSAENNLGPSVLQLTLYSATFQVVWLKSEEALIPLAWY